MKPLSLVTLCKDLTKRFKNISYAYSFFIQYENCAVLNRQCKKTDLAHTVESLASHYGDPGSSFNCLFNPQEPSEVILHVAALPGSFWAMLVTVCVLMLLSVGAPIIAYLTCGCTYVCTRSPPSDIQAEVDRRTGGGEVEMTEQPGEVAPPASNGAAPQSAMLQPQQQPLIQQPMYQQQQMLQPQYQPLFPPSQSSLPPPYIPSMAMPAQYQTLSPEATPGGGGGFGTAVTPVYGSPVLGASSRPGSQHYQPIPGSPMPPPLILYVHPGGVISPHPPAGTTPVTFQTNPPPSPVPSPSVMHEGRDGKDESNAMFYQ